jgi:hypothetical protein
MTEDDDERLQIAKNNFKDWRYVSGSGMTNPSVRDSAVVAVERLRHPIDNHMKTDLSKGGNELSHDRKNPTVYDTCRE